MIHRNRKRAAFSLIELVVVVVILGVLAALAIPQFSRGASDTVETRLKARLGVLRTAIALYFEDHGAYPGQNPDGTFPAGSPDCVARQLTLYTDAAGHTAPQPSDTCCFGPYLRNGIPPCPVSPGNPSAVLAIVRGSAMPGYQASASDAGWVYNPDTGYIAANSSATSACGLRYDRY